jgi:3-isopropylmalate dehydrogenase
MMRTALCCAQAQHGSAPTLAGKDLANPTSMILSVAMMVRWIGERKSDAQVLRIADCMAQAVEDTLAQADSRTRDLGGTLSTAAFAAAVAGHVQ